MSHEFKVGDIVYLTDKEVLDSHRKLKAGARGKVVVALSPHRKKVGVSFDNFHGGGNLGTNLPPSDSSGWWISTLCLSHTPFVPPTKEEKVIKKN